MKPYQLDECLNFGRLAEDCNSEGRCKVRRFPRGLKGQKDAVAPVLTADFRIIYQHGEHVPEINSGLIVVRSSNSRKPFTRRSVSMNLARLKRKFPQWAETNWSGIYLEVDEEAVFLAPLRRYQVPDGPRINFDQNNFDEVFTAELSRLQRKIVGPNR
jgi:hypothetical protein